MGMLALFPEREENEFRIKSRVHYGLLFWSSNMLTKEVER